jgi:hypothetical protein
MFDISDLRHLLSRIAKTSPKAISESFALCQSPPCHVHVKIKLFAQAGFAAMLGRNTFGNPDTTTGISGPCMTFRFLLGCVLALSACDQPRVSAPVTTGQTIAQVTLKPGQQPPAKDGACWDKDTTPAVIETVTEQVVVSDEIRDKAGNITAPASYRTDTHQRMVQDTREVWFRVPCPETMTVSFTASLQRALKARALYLAPVTGQMNAETAEALRRFQAERGLDSPVLSLAAAQELGLLATDISQL